MTTHQIKIVLNGKSAQYEVEPDETLLELLRRNSLYGARESCGQGVCGTCTVLVDERTVASCILFAHLAADTRVETIEGVGAYGELGVVQQAFIDEFGFQCGFCTPGMIVSVTQLLRENPNPTDEDIKHYLAGNLCRCGAYPEILKSVHRAAAVIKETSTD